MKGGQEEQDLDGEIRSQPVFFFLVWYLFFFVCLFSKKCTVILLCAHSVSLLATHPKHPVIFPATYLRQLAKDRRR